MGLHAAELLGQLLAGRWQCHRRWECPGWQAQWRQRRGWHQVITALFAVLLLPTGILLPVRSRNFVFAAPPVCPKSCTSCGGAATPVNVVGTQAPPCCTRRIHTMLMYNSSGRGCLCWVHVSCTCKLAIILQNHCTTLPPVCVDRCSKN